MKEVDINDIDLNESYFHFTNRSNLDSIDENGLQATSGGASKMVGDNDSRVYISKGGLGILKIKDTFLHEFKDLKICDIPLEYREYFDIIDFNSQDIVEPEYVYCAMDRKFKDEIYLKVDAREGEDFSREDVSSLWGIEHDIHCRENHDIDVSKLSIVSTENGDRASDIVYEIYDRLLKKNPGKEATIKDMFPELSEMFEYIKQRDEKIASLYTNKSKENVVSRQDVTDPDIDDDTDR